MHHLLQNFWHLVEPQIVGKDTNRRKGVVSATPKMPPWTQTGLALSRLGIILQLSSIRAIMKSRNVLATIHLI